MGASWTPRELRKSINYGEWELPSGAAATQLTISLPPSSATQGCRKFSRFVWSREAADHINPGAPHEACRTQTVPVINENRVSVGAVRKLQCFQSR